MKAHHEGVARGLKAAGLNVARDALLELQAVMADGAQLDELESKCEIFKTVLLSLGNS